MKRSILYTLCYVTFNGDNHGETIGTEFRYSIYNDHVLDQKRTALRLPGSNGTWANMEDSAQFFEWIRATQAGQTAQVTMPCVGNWAECSFPDRRELPTTGGIYALTMDEEVLYIGSTLALRRRWKGVTHHLFHRPSWGEMLRKRRDEIRIKFFALTTPHLCWMRFFEDYLIQEYLPKMNGAYHRSVETSYQLSGSRIPAPGQREDAS